MHERVRDVSKCAEMTRDGRGCAEVPLPLPNVYAVFCVCGLLVVVVVGGGWLGWWVGVCHGGCFFVAGFFVGGGGCWVVLVATGCGRGFPWVPPSIEVALTLTSLCPLRVCLTRSMSQRLPRC